MAKTYRNRISATIAEAGDQVVLFNPRRDADKTAHTITERTDNGAETMADVVLVADVKGQAVTVYGKYQEDRPTIDTVYRTSASPLTLDGVALEDLAEGQEVEVYAYQKWRPGRVVRVEGIKVLVDYVRTREGVREERSYARHDVRTVRTAPAAPAAPAEELAAPAEAEAPAVDPEWAFMMPTEYAPAEDPAEVEARRQAGQAAAEATRRWAEDEVRAGRQPAPCCDRYGVDPHHPKGDPTYVRGCRVCQVETSQAYDSRSGTYSCGLCAARKYHEDQAAAEQTGPRVQEWDVVEVAGREGLYVTDARMDGLGQVQVHPLPRRGRFPAGDRVAVVDTDRAVVTPVRVRSLRAGMVLARTRGAVELVEETPIIMDGGDMILQVRDGLAEPEDPAVRWAETLYSGALVPVYVRSIPGWTGLDTDTVRALARDLSSAGAGQLGREETPARRAAGILAAMAGLDPATADHWHGGTVRLVGARLEEAAILADGPSVGGELAAHVAGLAKRIPPAGRCELAVSGWDAKRGHWWECPAHGLGREDLDTAGQAELEAKAHHEDPDNPLPGLSVPPAAGPEETDTAALVDLRAGWADGGLAAAVAARHPGWTVTLAAGARDYLTRVTGDQVLRLISSVEPVNLQDWRYEVRDTATGRVLRRGVGSLHECWTELASDPDEWAAGVDRDGLAFAIARRGRDVRVVHGAEWDQELSEYDTPEVASAEYANWWCDPLASRPRRGDHISVYGAGGNGRALLLEVADVSETAGGGDGGPEWLITGRQITAGGQRASGADTMPVRLAAGMFAYLRRPLAARPS